MPSGILPGSLLVEERRWDSRTHLLGLGHFRHIRTLYSHPQSSEMGDEGFFVESGHPSMNRWRDMFEGFVRHGAGGGLSVGSG